MIARAAAFSVLAIVAATPLSAAVPAAWPDIAGTYWTDSYSPRIVPVGGGDLPYTAEAKADYAKNAQAAKAYTLADKARHVCTPDGIPRILQSPYPFEIVENQNRGDIYILYELNHVIRYIEMNKPLPSADELETFPFYSGHSVGHFDGDTLIIETAGYNEQTYLDNSGAPHTDQLRTVERMRRIAGGALEVVVTIHDPGVFTKDWSARYEYRPRNDIRIMDYDCGAKHRDLSSVKGVQGH